MILDAVAKTLGGLAKDTMVAIQETIEFLDAEITSIPDAIVKGYENGLLTGVTPEDDTVIGEIVDEPKKPFESQV